jgi:hypothetical protein
MPIPVTARSEASVCVPSLARIAGSNPAEGLDISLSLFLSCESFVLSGRDLRDGPIPGQEEFYLICMCLIQCGQENS